jgi:hypothetical protein
MGFPTSGLSEGYIRTHADGRKWVWRATKGVWQSKASTPSTLPSVKTINGINVLGSGDIEVGGGRVLGMKHLKYNGRFSTSGRITPLTLSYTKKITNSKLVIQSFLWGESNSHNSTLRIWNSVDGYFSDGSQGESDCSVKLDIGEYYSSDTNSTPGSASHTAVTSDITANTNVEFRWYVSSNTSLIGGSWGGNYEHAACWMVVTEIEND